MNDIMYEAITQTFYIHRNLGWFWEIKLNSISYETVTRSGALNTDNEEELSTIRAKNIAHSTLEEAVKYYGDTTTKKQMEGYEVYTPIQKSSVEKMSVEFDGMLTNNSKANSTKQKRSLKRREEDETHHQDEFKKVKKSIVSVF